MRQIKQVQWSHIKDCCVNPILLNFLRVRNGLGSKPNSDFSGSQDMTAWQKAAMLKTKLQSFFSNPMDTTMLQKVGD